MDFYSDTGQMVLNLISQLRPFPDFVKIATIIEPKTIPDNMWAYPEKRAYSIADPASTYLSFGYWLMDRDKVPETVKNNIIKAAAFFGIGEDIMDLAKQYNKAKVGLIKKASKEGFGLTFKQIYPLHTFEHVAQAINHFPKHYNEYPIHERMIIAKRIVKEAKAHGIPICSAIITKYAKAQPISRTDRAAANIAIRMQKTSNLREKQMYNKLGQMLVGSKPNVDTLFKIAGLLERLDRVTGLDKYYGTQLKDPVESVFNMTIKEAQDMLNVFNINGKNFLLEDLAGIPSEVYDEALGSDFLESVKGEDGTLDPQKLKDVITSLPTPDKNVLIEYLEQYIASNRGEDDMTEMSDEDWEGEEE